VSGKVEEEKGETREETGDENAFLPNPTEIDYAVK
jgi:hypothetical protein